MSGRAPAAATPVALSLRGLTKVYRNEVYALRGIDLDVPQGEFFGLLGPNGAGKSTTIGIVCSLVNKTAGQVSVFGHDLDRERARAQACIGLVPQEFNFSVFEKVEQIVVNQAGYYGVERGEARARAEHYLRKLGLWGKRRTPARLLSGGMKRRLMIARALVHDPRLLILDEPTAGVDIELRRTMWQFLREINEQGKTIILTTHYLEEAEQLCRQVAIIHQGAIVKHTSVRQLIAELDTETFILDLARDLERLPEVPGCRLRRVDARTLEVDLSREQNLNEVFACLTRAGITVMSMRNKANRLEELFLDIVDQDEAAAKAAGAPA